ncbi:hypothetical protein LR48_Vigan02g052100 [Vigna angularis]|uniref:Uncharacterized protein n=2 Tax=Phaseolus angularis TaxID=3914 RepID=A0A0L9TV42_PHAAN|nr:hypothetical protein LR48_Vigan02g052100 [Vigna angularis]BAT96217.1 hypothetical protein VIGAN_08312000 [Vigna angularis var. angularis]
MRPHHLPSPRHHHLPPTETLIPNPNPSRRFASARPCAVSRRCTILTVGQLLLPPSTSTTAVGHHRKFHRDSLLHIPAPSRRHATTVLVFAYNEIAPLHHHRESLTHSCRHARPICLLCAASASRRDTPLGISKPALRNLGTERKGDSSATSNREAKTRQYSHHCEPRGPPPDCEFVQSRTSVHLLHPPPLEHREPSLFSSTCENPIRKKPRIPPSSSHNLHRKSPPSSIIIASATVAPARRKIQRRPAPSESETSLPF